MDLYTVPTPCYVVDKEKLKKNLEILKHVSDVTGAHILLAQKAFSMYSLYPFVGEFLSGTTASGLYEAKLGFEEMKGKEVHVFSPAYQEEDMKQLVKICDHIVFNTPSQWNRFRDIVKAGRNEISCGIRINPEYSEIETDIYNPCFANSRMGTTLEQLRNSDIEGIEGLHFHTMCEQGADVLERTLTVVEEKFSYLFSKMKWVNFGGGHHITRQDYDLDKLILCIKRIKEKYGIEVYLEPGEAIALQAGYLVSTVLDTMKNGMEIAILDTSAACHMPDVLEMPYRPEIKGAGMPGDKNYTYRLAGPTCLAGDVIGDYSFDRPLEPGDKLVFHDMAIYSMVKNNTFNGMPLPAIAIKEGTDVEVIKRFGYEDFKMRLS